MEFLENYEQQERERLGEEKFNKRYNP